ncbi:MAG TPA: twin-arginine translocase subunit TatC [Actinomycetota bacterium]|nr:twin-arginine translocase subunit TatC [Actinomycetota bacterium]
MPLRRRRRDPEATMTVVEHLDELRKRLIISLGAVALCSVAGFAFYGRILGFLTAPYCRALAALPASARPAGTLAGCRLVYSSPVDPFLTVLKVGFFSGLLLALPVVLWQVWRFVTPALTKRQRRLGIAFVVVSVLLFAGGAIFSVAVVPRGLTFLFRFGEESLTPLLTADRYLGFLMFLILAFGLSFELPLAMVFLAGARVVTSTQMRRARRFVYLGLAVFAAILTPTQDPYTMLVMLVPLIGFYEVAILVARAFKR